MRLFSEIWDTEFSCADLPWKEQAKERRGGIGKQWEDYTAFRLKVNLLTLCPSPFTLSR